MPSAVRFHPRKSQLEQIQIIPRLSSYNEEELVALFGDQDEFIEMRESLHQDIETLSACAAQEEQNASESSSLSSYSDHALKRRLSDNMTFTSMGILDKTPGSQRLDEKLSTREAAWRAVLWEQYNFLENLGDCLEASGQESGSDSLVSSDSCQCTKANMDIALAYVYQESSQKAMERARKDAKRLARQVRKM